MKTSSPLLASAMAGLFLGFTASQAYSRNVVGYVNVALTNGYNFVANPLRTTNDHLSNIVAMGVPDGSKAYVWDATNQVFGPPSTFLSSRPGWDIDFDLPVGKGFVIYAPVRWTNGFVGEVLEGYLTNFVAGSNKFSLLGSKVPQEGALSANLAFPVLEGASAHFFRRPSQSFTDAASYFGGFGWFDPNHISGTGGPTNMVAESFFVLNPGPATNWIRYFIVQGPPPPTSPSAVGKTLSISNISMRAGRIALAISTSLSDPYNVQFSSDGVSWQTLATNQTAAVWVTRKPESSQGYFRLVQP
jgi:hypothetical protein